MLEEQKWRIMITDPWMLPKPHYAFEHNLKFIESPTYGPNFFKILKKHFVDHWVEANSGTRVYDSAVSTANTFNLMFAMRFARLR